MTFAIGANLWIWESPVTTEVIARHAPRLVARGFDLVELPLENIGDWDPAAVAPILREHGLGAVVCAAMGPGRDLTSPDDAVIASTQEYITTCIDAAVEVGSGFVVGPLYRPTGLTGPIDDAEREAMIDRLAETLPPLLEVAEETDVTLAIEPLNRFETSLFNTVEQILPLLERVDHPLLGLLLDTFHMNIEERDIGAAIRLAGENLVHFHACGNDRGAPGHDGIDWPAVRDALIDIDYIGAVSIESFTGANRTIATAASIWRPLAPSQDAIATDGLAFLRELFPKPPTA